MLRKSKISFSPIRKYISYFFFLGSIISLFDKDLWISASLTFLFIALIVYPDFFSIKLLKDRIYFIKNKFLNNSFKREYNLLLKNLLDNSFDNINSKLKNFSNNYKNSFNYLVFKLFKDIILNIKKRGKLSVKDKEALIFLSNLLANSESKIEKSELIKLIQDYYNFVISDYKITDIEKELLEKFLKIFNINLEEIGFNQDKFNKYYSIYLLEEKWELPDLKIEWEFPIILKKWEKIYWVEKAFIYKRKIETVRANYYVWGSTSIRIAKGVRFSVWSYKRPSYKQEVTYLEDEGLFVITNQRIWFIWEKQNFFIKYDKIVNFQLTDDWLLIMKENKQKPYIITLNDYEIVLILLSKILNNEI